MKKHLAKISLLPSLLLLANVAWAAPELSVEQGTYRFGTVAQGKKVQHSFKIRNSGDAPLQIKKIEVSCGCTAAKPSTSVIQPGKSAEIDVVFDSTEFGGKVVKSVTMSTNAGKTPSYTFNLEGTVSEELQVTPRQLSLGSVTPGVAKLVTINVTNNGNSSIRLIAVNVNSNTLQIKSTIGKSDLKPGETGPVNLSILVRSESKILSGYVHIVTSSARKKEITVPVYGTLAK
jgi:uncharacterized membrane protein